MTYVMKDSNNQPEHECGQYGKGPEIKDSPDKKIYDKIDKQLLDSYVPNR
jgi:hypothetical protein